MLIDNLEVIKPSSVKKVRVLAKVCGETVKEAIIRVKGGEAAGLLEILQLAVWPEGIMVLFEDMGDAD